MARSENAKAKEQEAQAEDCHHPASENQKLRPPLHHEAGWRMSWCCLTNVSFATTTAQANDCNVPKADLMHRRSSSGESRS